MAIVVYRAIGLAQGVRYRRRNSERADYDDGCVGVAAVFRLVARPYRDPAGKPSMISRCLVGLLLGFPLVALLLRLMLCMLPNDGADWIIPALILFFPLWLALITIAFAYRRAQHTWVAYGCANVAAFVLVRAFA